MNIAMINPIFALGSALAIDAIRVIRAALKVALFYTVFS